MHCYQDIYAHGNISAGPVTKFYRNRIFGHVGIKGVDNPYYNWINKSKTKVDEYLVKGEMTLSPRYYDTKKKTISLYKNFKEEVKEPKYLKNSFKW